jgi:hypothetical protein
MSILPGAYRLKAEIVSFRIWADLEEVRTDGSPQPMPYPASFTAPIEARSLRETANLDIRLSDPVRLDISGRVTRIPAGAKAFLNVNGLLRHGNTIQDVPVNDDGSFSLPRMEPGLYHLYAWADVSGEKLRSAIAKHELNDTSVTGVELSLSGGTILSGRIELAEKAGLPHMVALEPDEDFAGIRYSSAVDRNGQFEIKLSGLGKFRVTVSPAVEDTYVKSTELNGRVSISPEVDLTDLAEKCALKITVSAGGARISGKVERRGLFGDVAEPGLAQVYLMPESAKSFAEGRRIRGPDFDFRGVAPGRYRLLTVEPGLARTPFEQLVERAEMLEVKAGDKITRIIDLSTVPARNAPRN